MNTAELLDLGLITRALSRQIRRIAVQDIDILLADVDMTKEVIPHEAVVTLRVLFRQTHILVHVECHHIAEAHFARFVQLNQMFVHTERRTAGRKTQNERLALFRAKLINSFCYKIRSPLAQQVVRWFNNYSHIINLLFILPRESPPTPALPCSRLRCYPLCRSARYEG